MSSIAYIAGAMIAIIATAGVLAYFVSVPATQAQISSSSTTKVTITQCTRTTVTQTLSAAVTTNNPYYLNNLHGALPNGTTWISIDSHIFYNYNITRYGLLPPVAGGASTHWYEMTTCGQFTVPKAP